MNGTAFTPEGARVINSLDLARSLARILDEKQARDIRILDVRGTSSITDFHILATGTSSPHLRALANELRVQMKVQNVPAYRISGTPESGWVVSDFVDVIVHLFAPEARAYYDLDQLWKTAPVVTLE